MWAALAYCVLFLVSTSAQNCDNGSCYPATGDLLVGREKNLTASSTCGTQNPTQYCIVSHLQDITKCFICDSRQPYREYYNENSHRPENMVTTFTENRRKTWWQSMNGVESVHLQLDLEAEFHLTHLIMTFKTFRPAAMLIERSSDFGRTWQVYRYFAYNCPESFPGVPQRLPQRIGEVVCISRYSQVEPSTEGEVIYRVLPPALEVVDPYSQEVRDLLRITNLRINFTKLHTLGDELLDNRPKIREKYYYAVYDMIVRGNCFCYGHAETCEPVDGVTPVEGMVHGKCACKHNTKGLNCEACQDFFNDQPWRPARGRETNACKRCNCNSHSNKCHFDPAVYEQTGRVSGGVCDDCQHNTMGRNCEECKPFYYQDPNKDIRDPNICLPCDCDPDGAVNGGECESRTDPANNLVAGRCICKRNVDGERCDRCRGGYWNMRADNPEGCEATPLVPHKLHADEPESSSWLRQGQPMWPYVPGLRQNGPCQCNPIGTSRDQTCDPRTGDCICKRHVTGKNCDSCVPGFFGLSDIEEGCRPCDCDPGGAIDSQCNQLDGQCKCRPHMTGRRCDEVQPGFYAINLDNYKYEAEDALPNGEAQIDMRQCVPGATRTWTGPGFRSMREGSSLEFTINNIPMSMEYDIVIRYEPQLPDSWDEVGVTLTRPGIIETSSICGNTIPSDDVLSTSLPPGSRYRVMATPFCLEEMKEYTIKVEFRSYQSGRTNPQAAILFDSLVLVPRYTSVPIFQGQEGQSRRDEFERYRCQENYLPVLKPQIPPICKSMVRSISAIMHNGGMRTPCNCDVNGAESTVCDPEGGQCPCRNNVIGQRCDMCCPATFGLGPQGCRACDCDASGSRDLFCNPSNGQCLCNPGAYGRRCNRCQDNFWNFPNCQRCNCNGHADRCDSVTGSCIDCRDNTAGQFCQTCKDGYYGDPRLQPGGSQPCRECMCPGGISSGRQFADRCYQDPRSQAVICNCNEGYTGPRCDSCAPGFYGNPEVPGGSCRRCECNNNIDMTDSSACDSRTGECLKCLYNTEGPRCDRCQAGYYGTAKDQDCKPVSFQVLSNSLNYEETGLNKLLRKRRETTDLYGHYNQLSRGALGYPFARPRVPLSSKPRAPLARPGPVPPRPAGPTTRQQPSCVCNMLGTDRTRARCQDGGLCECDRATGQCPCLPNVVGQQCDRCAPDYWKIASGRGCEACSCDPVNSLSTQCNEFDGQCRCKPGFGGRTCTDCETNYWGDPRSQCSECNCDPLGSETLQCDRNTGQCRCRPGVTGMKCDQCARGTRGNLPQCVPCGECFDNWDNIIKGLENETRHELDRAKNIESSGVPGAYDDRFKGIEDDLNAARNLLGGGLPDGTGVQELEAELDGLKDQLETQDQSLDGIENDLGKASQDIRGANDDLDDLEGRLNNLNKDVDDFKKDVDRVKNTNTVEALKSIKEAQQKSQDAQAKADGTQPTLGESEQTREEAERLMAANTGNFGNTDNELKNKIAELENQADMLSLREVNEKVCGDPIDETTPCEQAKCGRAGCYSGTPQTLKCGGLGCSGALEVANTAKERAEKADAELQKVEDEARRVLDEVRRAKTDADDAKTSAQNALDRAKEVRDKFKGLDDKVNALLEQISAFLQGEHADPDSVLAVAQEVLAKNIQYTPQQILDLAKNIDEKVKTLSGVDAILEATENDLKTAQDLLSAAMKAKEDADKVKTTAEEVRQALDAAEVAQRDAEQAIRDAQGDIDDAEGKLTGIESEISLAVNKINDASAKIAQMNNELTNEIGPKYTKNQENTKSANDIANAAMKKANDARSQLDDLRAKYEEAQRKVNDQSTPGDTSAQATKLRQDAAALASEVQKQLTDLQNLKLSFTSQTETLTTKTTDLTELQRRMETILQEITTKATEYSTCTT
ncbi:laminin subunit beta-1-like isoform X6 [Branchiostoma floridae]|nr:laminin subunit beta-1-like isoform X6 [Branchiostoma floridae]XP_035677864.1 laminin subunit beta-1-like isoform X6 [Branchiostoma floridae]